MVDIASASGWGGSSRTRFYLNAIYHYVSSLFLVDKSKKSHEGLPMGGTAIRALHPMGLAPLLDRVRVVVERPFGRGNTFGDSVLKLRHSYLVHGTFSPESIEYLIEATRMRTPAQQLTFQNHVWDLFHEVVLFRLGVVAVFTHHKLDYEGALRRYMATVSPAHP